MVVVRFTLPFSNELFRNSRRLKEAVSRIDEAIDMFRTRTREMTLADVEGDERLFNTIQTSLRLAADYLVLRFKYLKVVPWSFAQADSPEGAAEFIRGATSKPLGEQDELTAYLYVEYRLDLEERARGGPCSERLAEAVAEICNSPLDESAGEGYHRSTHHALTRARNAKSPHLKASTRRKQVTKLLKFFMRFGEAGRRVIRFEWRHWKRILQSTRKLIWRPRRIKTKQFLERVYRMDAMAEVDWSTVCRRIHAPGQGPAPQARVPARDKKTQDLHIEYLLSVMKPLQWYTVETPKAGMDEDGNPEEVVEHQHFQVLNIITSKSRPHLMPTIESHDDVAMINSFAALIQEVTPKPDIVFEGGGVVVFPDSEPLWKRLQDLGPFHVVRRSLTHYQQTGASAEHAGCVALRQPVRALPMHPVTDMRCPALSMLAALYRAGWRNVEGRVVHTTLDVGPMDGREAVRMKPYYVVLLQLPVCLPLTSSIPSDQPLLFYKLLLAGTAVEPGRGHAFYLALQRGLPALEPVDDVSEEEIQTKNRLITNPSVCMIHLFLYLILDVFFVFFLLCLILPEAVSEL